MCILTLQYHSQTFNLKPNPTPSPSTAVKPVINLNQTKPSYPNLNQAILTKSSYPNPNQTKQAILTQSKPSYFNSKQSKLS